MQYCEEGDVVAVSNRMWNWMCVGKNPYSISRLDALTGIVWSCGHLIGTLHGVPFVWDRVQEVVQGDAVTYSIGDDSRIFFGEQPEISLFRTILGVRLPKRKKCSMLVN